MEIWAQLSSHWKTMLKRRSKILSQHLKCTALWRSLLIIGKIDEALLFAAEQGHGQTLSDNWLIQYELAPRLSSGA